jgi:hypothetical protein
MRSIGFRIDQAVRAAKVEEPTQNSSELVNARLSAAIFYFKGGLDSLEEKLSETETIEVYGWLAQGARLPHKLRERLSLASTLREVYSFLGEDWKYLELRIRREAIERLIVIDTAHAWREAVKALAAPALLWSEDESLFHSDLLRFFAKSESKAADGGISLAIGQIRFWIAARRGSGTVDPWLEAWLDHGLGLIGELGLSPN